MATWVPINGLAIQLAKNAAGVAAADYYLKFYDEGTTTPASMATDSTGGTTLDKCKLDANGLAVNGSDDPFIPHIDRNYKIACYTNATDADNNATGSAFFVIDNVKFSTGEAGGIDYTPEGTNASTISIATYLDNRVLDDVAALRAYEPVVDEEQVWILGHTTEGIGGGAFYYDQTDSTTADNNGTVIVTSGGARWKRKDVEVVNPEMFGGFADLDVAALAATTDSGTIATIIAASTDNQTALEASLDYAVSQHKEFVLSAGGYYTSARLTPTTLTAAESFQNRNGNVKIKGQGISNSVIYTDAAQYIIDITNGVTTSIDVVEVSDCMLWSPNGGGITTPDGMWRNYKRVFFHGAASGFYGHYDNGDAGAGFGVFMINQEDCIFWNKNGYFGGAYYINNFHTFNSKNAFISQNRFNGDVCKFEDGKSISIPSIVLEGVPNGATPTNQAFINFAGTLISVDIGVVYVEGVWNRIFRNGSNADKNINIESIFAWQRNISGFGDADCLIYSGQSSDVVEIGRVLYVADSTVGAPSTNTYLIQDNSVDDSRISVTRFENQTTSGGQQNRALKANYRAHRHRLGGFRNSLNIGITTNPGFSFNLDGPGSYIININYLSIDRNHGGTETFIITYDDASSNDFNVVTSIATITTKSGQFTSMNPTVNSSGLVIVNSSALSQDWNVFYSVDILSQLPNINGSV